MNKRIIHSGEIKKDWFGADCPDNHFSLSSTKEQLCFEVEVQQTPAKAFHANAGEFLEGLWEYDVAELFISSSNSKHYLEINLAPNCAWWLMAFSAPRQRIADFHIDHQDIKTESSLDTDRWKSSLCIPHGLLQNILRTDTMRFNVTYILGEPKQYLSFCNLQNATPDFHIPAHFKNLSC